jgi:hypothetical protein
VLAGEDAAMAWRTTALSGENWIRLICFCP